MVLPQDRQVNSRNEIIAALIENINQLKKELNDVKGEKFLETLKLDKETLTTNEIRVNCVRNPGPLLEFEIKEAQSKTDSATKAAAYLTVSYKTYKKYCKKYNLWRVSPCIRGFKKKYFNPNKGPYPLKDIVAGKHPNYTIPFYRLKDKLIRSGLKEAKCERCGENRQRFGDNRIPLVLDFIDGNRKNHKLENIELLCYNCIFLFGRGYLRGKKPDDFYFQSSL